jgi:23S rRNA (guanine745-N1)-methyltransferase
VNDAWPLTCPVCSTPLQREPGVLRCARRHSYDIAREGYVNLLSDTDRERGIQGDSPDMLRARRRFLDAGWFQPLRDALGEEARGARCILEVGCGEGYYIGNIAESEARCIGIDIAKDAVRLASQRYRNALFAVANVRKRLYVEDGSADALLSVFAPRNAAEFARVVRPGGSVLIAIPSPAHMANVRADYGMLDIEESKEERIEQQFNASFNLAARRTIEYPLTLTADAVREFIAMGPTARHGVEHDVAGAVTTVASFVLLRLERRSVTLPANVHS